jgi:hypothetical protein
MQKYSFWCVVLGTLAAAGMLIYLQLPRSQPKKPQKSNMAVRPTTAPPVRAAHPAPLPSATLGPPKLTGKAAPPPPANVARPARPVVAPTGPAAVPVFESAFYFDRLDQTGPSLLPEGEFWSTHAFGDPSIKSETRVFSQLDKRPKGGESLSFSGSGASGFATQYSLIKSEDTKLLGRVASRFSQVYPGLSDEERVSELVFGAQFEHRLGRRNKLYSAVEYGRDPVELGNLHVRKQASWELLLDPKENLSLRSGVSESSTYTPNKEQAKNVNYNVNLIWKF